MTSFVCSLTSPNLLRFACLFIVLLFVAQHNGYALDGDFLDTLPTQPLIGYSFKIPPKPDKHILDTATFLTEETLQKLDQSLSTAARDHSIYVYVLIVPSVQKGTLDPFTQQVAKEWTKGLFGAVIVFDDGTGHLSIQQSELVSEQFYEFELSMLLKETMSASKRPRLSRDALVHTIMNLKESIATLKTRAERENQSSFRAQVIFGAIAALIVVLGGLEFSRSRSPKGVESLQSNLS